MKKLKIYFLTNIFTNTHYAFVPNILDENINKLLTEFTDLSSVNKKKVIEAIKSKEENIDLANISLIKDHTKIVPINIELYNINDFKNYLYQLTNILPENQLIFVKNNNVIDYIHRLNVDKLNPKYRIIEEPLGFYYKNNLGKRLIGRAHV